MTQKLFTSILVSILIVFISHTANALTLNDNGKINPTEVSSIIHVTTEQDIFSALKKANKENLPVSIMGIQHSQGGQTLVANGISLDMRAFNKILDLNVAKKRITVQSGILWSDIQKYINPYNLAVKSMQSPNIFTVGGSLSVNAHGDDLRAGAVGNSILAFHLVLANGQKILVTPNSHPDLWQAVRGGYGLMGVVTDVTLQLTDNFLLTSHYQEMTLEKFQNIFVNEILNNKQIALFYAHVNITPNQNIFRNLYVVTYSNTNTFPKTILKLNNPEQWNFILTPMFNMSRNGRHGKEMRWNIERKIFSRFYRDKIVTRNNAMEKPVRFASNYTNPNSADWLQEYFIPVANLSTFMDFLGKIVLAENINLLNVTIRYVPAENDILLSYAKKDCFAVVLYFNQELSTEKIAKAETWTQKLIDAAFSVNGNYYLPYQGFASQMQFRNAYPNYLKFIQIKKQYDPQTRFSNTFYKKYFMNN